MNFDTPSLIDEDNFYIEDRDMEHEDDDEVHEDDPMPQETASSEKGTTSSSSSSRRRAKCWNNFTIEEKYSDGRTSLDYVCSPIFKFGLFPL